MLDDSITEHIIEDRNVKTDNCPDEPEYDGDIVQLNVEQELYGEQSITDDSDDVMKNRDQEITKSHEI